MIILDNITIPTTIIQHSQQSTYNDNEDIIWPTVVGIFVTLALGWMICRYKCSSQERSPHVVRCCPKSLCKTIRLCCISIFRFKNESQQHSSFDSRISTNKRRRSNNSILEIPFMINNSSSQQWPLPFLLNNNNNQGPSFPLSITIQSTIDSSQPQRHPLGRESIFIELKNSSERRDSSPWLFPTSNMIFHKQTNEIKRNHLFLNA